MRVKFNIDTQLVFQIGDPIGHSGAAFLHNAMYDLANLNAICLTATVKKGQLPEFIRAAKLLNANGFDITMPHKSDIIEWLDECDEVSREFKCVNHVKIVDGKLIGIGLDGVGMAMAIEDETGPVFGKAVLILGAGAVSGPIAAELCQRGAASVTITNRTIKKAQDIADKLQALYGTRATTIPFDEVSLNGVAPSIDLVVQCTSLGMQGHADNFSSIDFIGKLPDRCVVADVLYPSSLILETARSRGLEIVTGVGMMLQQQLAMMDFRFGVKLQHSALLEAEEALAIAITMRELRFKRLKLNN